MSRRSAPSKAGVPAGSRPAAARILRFALVGGIGFLVDTGTLTLLHDAGGADPFSSRLLSISVAALTTWRLNRSLTFGASPAGQAAEGLRYGVVALLAAALNYLLYAGILLLAPAFHPIGAVIAATLVAMGFSYVGYSRYAFQGGRSAVLVSPRSHIR